jgi:predicted phage tail protein
MLRKIKLYGKLAKFIGHRVLEADVATAAEAVRFLVANWPEVERHMADQHYRVSIGTYDIDLEELHHPAGAAPISFVPVVAGAGAVGRIIAGIALVALSFLISPHSVLLPTGCWHCNRCRPCGRQSAARRHRPTPNTHTKDQQRRRRPTQEF